MGKASGITACVDEITRSRVLGWVLDTNRPGEALSIAIKVNGHEAMRCTANEYRDGLEEHGCGSNHGFIFEFDPPLSVFEEQTIEVTIVDPPEPIPGGSKKLSAPRLRKAPGDVMPVILTSTGRAGTTLLMSEFVRHPGLIVAGQYPFETKLISYYAAAFRALVANEDREHSTDPDRMFAAENRKLVGHNPYNSPGQHSFAKDRAPFERFFEQTVPEKLGALFRDLIFQYYELTKTDSGKARAAFFAEKGVLDEAPRQAARLFFGDVREIVMVRDPRDLMCSAMSFWKYSSANALKMLNETLPQLEAIHDSGASDTLFLRYEDLIEHPQVSRRAVYRLIGIDPGVEGVAETDTDLFKAHGTSRDPAASIGRWRTELSPDQIATCDRKFASFLRRFGYSPSQNWPRSPFIAIEITFGTTGNSRAYLREGWSEPEAGYTWTLGSESRLQFPQPAPARSYYLELQVRPFIWQDQVPSQRMMVSVNDVPLGAITVERPGVVKAPVPWTVLAAKAPATLLLSFPDAARPSEVQGTQDKRRLALAFEKLTLFSASTGLNEQTDLRTEAVAPR
jgi:hypothetical protein